MKLDPKLAQIFSWLLHDMRGFTFTVSHVREAVGRGVPLEKYLPLWEADARRMDRAIQNMSMAVSLLQEAPPQKISAQLSWRRVLEEATAQIASDRISLEIREDVQMSGDASLLRLALGNIIQNALIYGTPEGLARVVLVSEPERIKVAVEALGIPLSPDEIARVGSPFWRSEAAIRFAPRGSGLSLWVSRSIASLHGGDLHIESHPVREDCSLTKVSLVFPRQSPSG